MKKDPRYFLPLMPVIAATSSVYAPMDWPGYGSFHCPWCAGKAALALSPVGGGDGGGK